MPPACRPWTSALDTLECPYPDCMRIFAQQGNFKRHLRMNDQRLWPPLASHQHSHPPRRRLNSPHRRSPTKTPEPNGSIPTPALDKILEESNSKDVGLCWHIPHPQSVAEEADTEGADLRETPMDEENPEIKVYSTPRRTFCDNSYYTEFWHLINNPWLPSYYTEDFKLAIRFVEAHFPKPQIDYHFNEGWCKIPEYFSYTSGWTMYNQIYAFDNQLRRWRETVISTPHGQSVFYFRDPVEYAWYRLRQRPYNNHMVGGPTRTIDAEGDRVYSQMNSAEWWWEMQDRLLPGATIVPLICGLDKTQLTDFSSDKKAWPIYMTIGNIHSSIQNKYSNVVQIVFAILPVLPKFQWNSTSDDRAQRDKNQQLRCDIAQIMVEAVTRFLDKGEIISGALWPCSDSKIQLLASSRILVSGLHGACQPYGR